MNGVLEYFVQEGWEGEAMQELAQLCAIPSVSAKKQELEPCAVFVAELLKKRGIDTQLIYTEGAPPVVFGEARSKRPDAPTVLFYNHYDVQPAEPLELWESDPFVLTQRDGKAFARGVGDDKGHIISRLCALDAIRALNGGEYPFHVKFFIEGEEEVGSPHIQSLMEQHGSRFHADFCIWEEGVQFTDGTPYLYCGMRGIAYFELSVRTLARDAHSGVGGSLLPNAAWRLVWALSTLKDKNENILLPGHYDKVRPLELSDLTLLENCPSEEEELRAQFGLEENGFLGGNRTRGLEWKRRAVFEPTLTLCGIESGWQGEGAKTVLPAVARCKMDFRLVPDQDPLDVFHSLRTHLDSHGFEDIEVHYLGGQRPARVSPSHTWVKLAADVAYEVYGIPAVISPIVGGSGPMWWFSEYLGMPITSPGIEYPSTAQHAPNENIRLEDFRRGTIHLARLLERIEEAITPS